MVQAAFLNGPFFDLLSPFDDGCAPPEVGIGGCDVSDALVVAVVIIIIDESADLGFEIAGQIIILQQYSVLQRLMPALDLTLGLRVIRRATDMIHTLAVEPFSQIAGDVGRTIVAEQPRLVGDLGAIAA